MMGKHEFSTLVITKEKMALLTNSKEYELAMAKSTSTPYKMLKRTGRTRGWHEIRKRLAVYSLIATDVHAASDLHRKQ